MEGEGSLRQSERADLVEIALSSWKRTIERVGERRVLELEQKLAPPHGQFFRTCNVHEVSVVFDNILDNAVKYTADGGRITLRIETSDTHFRARVTDDGMGIEKKDLKKIFGRFFRADKSSLKKVHGSGLGLFVCQTIVKSHKGRIFATSDGPGKGSTFYVEFPGNPADR
jgi:signal transduction histidine kinase